MIGGVVFHPYIIGSVDFEDYLTQLKARFETMDYHAERYPLNAFDFGMSELRPRVVIDASCRRQRSAPSLEVAG